jgi:hypothetical protein
MDDEPAVTKPTTVKQHVDHWKWLVGVLGGLLLLMEGFGWVEGRIEKRVEERVLTATSISRLDNYGKESKTWMDGRINTLTAEVDALRRELGILRLDVRTNATTIRSAPESAPASPK